MGVTSKEGCKAFSKKVKRHIQNPLGSRSYCTEIAFMQVTFLKQCGYRWIVKLPENSHKSCHPLSRVFLDTRREGLWNLERLRVVVPILRNTIMSTN